MVYYSLAVVPNILLTAYCRLYCLAAALVDKLIKALRLTAKPDQGYLNSGMVHYIHRGKLYTSVGSIVLRVFAIYSL